MDIKELEAMAAIAWLRHRNKEDSVLVLGRGGWRGGKNGEKLKNGDIFLYFPSSCTGELTWPTNLLTAEDERQITEHFYKHTKHTQN